MAGSSVLMTVAFALGASLPLLIGAVIGSFWQPPDKVAAVAMAFAAGALISALAFELFEVAFEFGGAWRAGLGFAVGALVFVVFDSLLDRLASGNSSGLVLLAAVTLDGIPENTGLGVTLTASGSIALLAAVFASNFPEGLVGAAGMRDDGRSRRSTIGLWAGATLLLGTAVLVGRWVFAGASDSQLALPLAFAGGAVLASVIDTLAPEAYREGGPWVALASVAGFFLAFMLGHA